MSANTLAASNPSVARKGLINVGLIGAGGISQSQHLPNLLRAPRICLRSVCDLSAALLKDVSSRFEGSYAIATKYKDVLSDPHIHAVLIATKPDSHIPLTLEALAAGKHVYVEKPLSENESDAQQVVAAQNKAEKLVAIGFNRRFAPAYQRAKALIKKHGGAKNIYYRLSDAYWFWGKDMPPGVRMIHEVCHIFDILRFLADSEVRSVYCVSSRPDDEIITLQFDNKCVATIMNTGYVHYDMPKEQLEVITERGGLTVNDFVELRAFGLAGEPFVERYAGHTHPERDCIHRYLLKSGGAETMMAIRRAHYEAVVQSADLGVGEDDESLRIELENYLEHHAPHVNYMMDKGWMNAIDHFAQSIQENSPCELSGAIDGLRVSQITNAALKSRESGLPVLLG